MCSPLADFRKQLQLAAGSGAAQFARLQHVSVYMCEDFSCQVPLHSVSGRRISREKVMMMLRSSQRRWAWHVTTAAGLPRTGCIDNIGATAVRMLQFACNRSVHVCGDATSSVPQAFRYSVGHVQIWRFQVLNALAQCLPVDHMRVAQCLEGARSAWHL